MLLRQRSFVPVAPDFFGTPQLFASKGLTTARTCARLTDCRGPGLVSLETRYNVARPGSAMGCLVLCSSAREIRVSAIWVWL